MEVGFCGVMVVVLTGRARRFRHALGAFGHEARCVPPLTQQPGVDTPR